MNVLSLDNVSKTLLDAPLFEGVSLGIDDGERIGFIGKNGTGKSTFLKILHGVLPPDTGTVSRHRELTMSGLEQHPLFTPGTTLREFCFHGSPAASDPAAEARVYDSFWSLCRELGLHDSDAPVDALSGGMLRKASLARCLSRGARMLTLDEPTNHLDLDTIEWLESLLRRASFAFIVVTHDRYFLDAVCTASPEPALPDAANDHEVDALSRRKAWARLLVKVHELDVMACPRCGSRMAVIAVITDPAQIRKIIACLDRHGRGPPPPGRALPRPAARLAAAPRGSTPPLG